MQSLAPSRFYPLLGRIRFSGEIQSIRGAANSIPRNIPAKPRKPGNSFIQFLKDVEPKIKADRPSCSRKELVKVAGQMWKSADEKIRSQYEDLFKELNARYDKVLQAYHENLTDDQKAAIAKLNEFNLKQRKMSKIKKTLDELGRPKRPPSAFGLYMSEINCKPLANEKCAARLKRIAETYQALPEAEREKYVAKYADLRQDYLIEREKWEAKILATIDNMSKSNEDDENKSKTASKPRKNAMSKYIAKLFEKHSKK